MRSLHRYKIPVNTGYDWPNNWSINYIRQTIGMWRRCRGRKFIQKMTVASKRGHGYSIDLLTCKSKMRENAEMQKNYSNLCERPANKNLDSRDRSGVLRKITRIALTQTRPCDMPWTRYCIARFCVTHWFTPPNRPTHSHHTIATKNIKLTRFAFDGMLACCVFGRLY